jgi:hypothetical protein
MHPLAAAMPHDAAVVGSRMLLLGLPAPARKNMCVEPTQLHAGERGSIARPLCWPSCMLHRGGHTWWCKGTRFYVRLLLRSAICMHAYTLTRECSTVLALTACCMHIRLLELARMTNRQRWPGATRMALFSWLIICTFQLVFLVGTVFFSYANQPEQCFSLFFQYKWTGPMCQRVRARGE